MSLSDVKIASIGTAVPPCEIPQSLADTLIGYHYKTILSERSKDVLHRLLSHPGIRKRHYSFESPDQLIRLKNEDPDLRIERFREWAVRLSSEAARKSIEKAGISANDIGCIIVNTCTGYICPGISTYLIDELSLRKNIKAFDMVGAGCGGAIPNLQLASSLAQNENIVLSISVEICSATFEMDNDMSLIMSNAIFGDGAAAVILWNRPEGIRIMDTSSRFEPAYRDDVRYIYKKGRLHNQLSPSLPKVIGSTVVPFMRDFLCRCGISPQDIHHWAIHPGGEKIITELQERFGLADQKVGHTRKIMKNFGNMSSPTVLFVLEEIMKTEPPDGDNGLVLAFGAGLSIHAILVKW
jgi:predicted naringenin-chalcone synthase